MAPTNGAPLREFSIVRSDDPVEAHGSATTLLNRHGMRLAPDRRRFTADIRSATIGPLGLLYFSYGCAVEISPDPLQDFVVVHMPLAGRLAVSSDRGDAIIGPGGGSIVSPTDRVRMRWSSDLELLVLRIGRTELERKLESLTGRRVSEPIVLSPTFDHDAAGRSLEHAIHSLQSSVDAFGAQGVPDSLATTFHDLVASVLLLEQRPGADDERVRVRADLASRAVERVAEFVRDHPAQHVSVRDLARAASVSERALYEAFRRERGCTPMTWVRDVRMARARADLLAADPASGVTVADIVRRNALGHAGRFATDYRQRYGESPSCTLRLQ